MLSLAARSIDVAVDCFGLKKEVVKFSRWIGVDERKICAKEIDVLPIVIVMLAGQIRAADFQVPIAREAVIPKQMQIQARAINKRAVVEHWAFTIVALPGDDFDDRL